MTFSTPFARVGVALACAVLTCAHAETLVPDVVITSTRFAQDLTPLPQGVTVVTADQIRSSGASTVNQALMSVLGVAGRQDYYGGGDYNLDLRGFGITADSNQVVILDGIRLNEGDLGGTRLAGIPIEDVVRIEILRGNGTVLYGEGASGGVIAITTRAGQGRVRENQISAYGSVGSMNSREIRTNATLVSEGFTLDLNGQSKDSHNHRDNFRSQFDGGGVTAQWSGETTRVGIRHSRDALSTGLPGSLSTAQYVQNPRQASTNTDRAQIKNNLNGLFLTTELAGWAISVDAGWREKTLNSTNYVYDVDAQQFSVRAQKSFDVGSIKNTLSLGQDHGEWIRTAYGSQASQKSNALYLKNDLSPWQGTRVSAGLRTEKFDKLSGVTVLQSTQNAWDLGVSQRLNAQLTGWARAGNSFRLANVDEFSFTNPSVAIRPQTSKDLEVGIRWADGFTRSELRAYRSALTDEIGYDPAAMGVNNGANINFAPTLRQGLEWDTDVRLNAKWTFGARLAVRQSVFRSGSYSDKDVPLAPRHTLALRTEWTPAQNHHVFANVNIVGAQYPDFANQCKMPSYTTLDARYAYQVKRVEYSLGVKNLLDHRFYTQAYGCNGNQTTSIYPEAGRVVNLAVRLHY
jgi:iron complex outermembrane receptor protein